MNQSDNLRTMPKLANRRWEIFATELASGAPLLSSYLTAGYKASYSARFNASRLRNTKPVRERIDELLSEFADRSFVKLEWVQAKLVEIAEGKAESKGGIRDGKPFSETDRLAALTSLARTLGIGDTSVNVNAAAAVGYDPLEINDATRIAALEAFMARVKLKQPAPAVLDYTDADLDDMERRLNGH